MNAASLCGLLSGSTYPGRGIALGNSEDGKSDVAIYFIMGRSENSRNRVFTAQGEALRTEPFDSSRVVDPSLIIYSPVRVYEDQTIVTNGDQTDTIYESLALGKTFIDALRTRTFEPDAPNFTPRISGILRGGRYSLSILKCEGGDETLSRRYFYEYEGARPGQGHFIHTYEGDGNPLPSFIGEPRAVALSGSIDELSAAVWAALDAENKISLFVRFIDRESGKTETRIINKYQK